MKKQYIKPNTDIIELTNDVYNNIHTSGTPGQTGDPTTPENVPNE